MLGNFSCAVFFKFNVLNFFFFKNTIRMPNGLDPDQNRRSGPIDLLSVLRSGSKLSAEVISRYKKLPLAS